MAMYAFLDELRTKEILSRDAKKEDKYKRFFCPNPDCDAHLHIVSVDGLVSAYFKATDRNHPHINGCYFSKKSNKFMPNKFNEDEFYLENALSALTIPTAAHSEGTTGKAKTGKSSLKPPHTISQIYSMCKTYSCKDSYNGVVIGQILLDNRSFYMYPRGVFGWRVIEAHCERYFYKKNDDENLPSEIYLSLSHKEKTYNFTLQFLNQKLFKQIRSYLHTNQDKTVIVAGKWESAYKPCTFKAQITSKRQITFI